MSIVSVDCGRYAVKSYGNKKIIFPSIVGEWRERKISSGGEYEVTINNQRYFIGELAKEESRYARDMTTRSKIHEETKILTLTSIALQADSGRVQLVTALPVEQHTPKNKENLKKLISGNHTIEINGIRKNIIIAETDIIVSIEGAGAYIYAPLSAKCRIIDAGSRTINTLTIDEKGKYRDLESGTLDYGCMDLLLDDRAEQFSRKIITDLSKVWKKYSDETVLMTGGGAGVLGKYLSKQFNTMMISDPIYANTLGFYKLGVSAWRK